MRALTIKQPHANRIASGKKRIELRSWATDYRGPLAIHAGKSIDRDEAARLKLGESELRPLGCVVCVVELVDIRPSDYRYDGRGTFSVASWGWVLRKPRRVEPVEVTGKLGLFSVGDIKLRYQ